MPSSSDSALQLRKGISAARSGRSDEARHLLHAVVRADPDNEMAWLWLSGLMATNPQKRECLEQVLRTNPRNVYARAGLARLRKAVRAEEEIFEARLSSVAGQNGHAPSPAPITGGQTGVQPISSRQETPRSKPQQGAAVARSVGDYPERRGASARKRKMGGRRPGPAPDSCVTTCPSCDQPLSYTATECPHCLLTFTPLSEVTPPEQTARSSFGRSLKSGLSGILVRLRIQK
jgi:hypothetical protein